jgi:hypothetical protein
MNKEQWLKAKSARSIKTKQLEYMKSIEPEHFLTIDPQFYRRFNDGLHNSIIDRFKKEIEALDQAIEETKEFLFNWKSGGWNSVYAIHKEEAIERAAEVHKDSKLEADPKTFRVSTPVDYEACLRSFY